MFRELNAIETAEFRAWARANNTAQWREKAEILHPVVRDEWAVMDRELQMARNYCGNTINPKGK